MRKICVLLVAFMLVIPLAAFALDIQETVNITINGELVEIPEEYGAVMIVDDRTLVPIRFVTQYLNFSVAWDNHRQAVIITSTADNRHNFALFIGEDFILDVNNVSRIQMGTPAIIHNDRTYIPIRFLAEAIGYTVTWNEDTRTVDLSINQ